MITYIWTITSLSTVPRVDARLDVVVVAQWTLTGTDAIGVQASLNSCSQFILTQGAGYTPYDELTEDQVIGWVQAELGTEGVNATKTCIENQITSIINPVVIPAQQTLPWAV
jgi:hypothetical protein